MLLMYFRRKWKLHDCSTAHNVASHPHHKHRIFRTRVHITNTLLFSLLNFINPKIQNKTKMNRKCKWTSFPQNTQKLCMNKGPYTAYVVP